MGSDKATLVVGVQTLARTVCQCLEAVAGPVVEVGPGVAGTSVVVRESPAGGGPLAGVVAGTDALHRLRYRGPVLLVACDLPLVTVAALTWLATFPAVGSIVPTVDGRPQPLCARWSAVDLDAARDAYASGERSLRPLLRQPDVHLVDERWWGSVASPLAFADVDTPTDLSRLGLRSSPGTGPLDAPDTRDGIGTISGCRQ